MTKSIWKTITSLLCGCLHLFASSSSAQIPYESIFVADTSRCLNVHYGRHNQPGSPATVYPCAPSLDQQWHAIEVERDWVQLKNLSTGLCLSGPRFMRESPVAATLAMCDDATAQHWRRVSIEGKYNWLGRLHGGCLMSLNDRAGSHVEYGLCDGGDAQRWGTHTTNTLNSNCGLEAVLAGTDKVWLPKCHRHMFTHAGAEKSVTIYYTEGSQLAAHNLHHVDTDGDGETDMTPIQMVTSLANYYETSWRVYLDQGFGDPGDRNKHEVHVFEMGRHGWCCKSRGDVYISEISANSTLEGFAFDDNPYTDENNLKSTAYHEMFHAVEFNKGTRGNSEGIATLIPDHVDEAVDHFQFSDFLLRANRYLNYGHQKTLRLHDYTAALWWKYFSEQAAAQKTEPLAGIQAIRGLWNHEDPLSVGAIEQTIANHMTGMTFRNLWVNFTVANIARQYHGIDGVRVPPYFFYHDELEVAATKMGRVGNLVVNQPLDLFNQAIQLNDPVEIQPLAARYFVIKPSAEINTVRFQLNQSGYEALSFTTLVIGNGTFRHETTTSRDFNKAVRNVRKKTLILVVTGTADIDNTTVITRITGR